MKKHPVITLLLAGLGSLGLAVLAGGTAHAQQTPEQAFPVLRALTLPETAYLYTGLALQQTVRTVMRPVVNAILIASVVYLLGRAAFAHRAGFDVLRFVRYLFVSPLLLLLFWPEAAGRFGLSASIRSTQVTSAAAEKDPGATVITAKDTGLVPTTPAFPDPAVVPAGTRILLGTFLELHLGLAQRINDQNFRYHSPVYPMSRFWELQLNSDAKAAVADWTQGCFLPAKTKLLQRAEGLGFAPTFQDLLPWPVGGQTTELQKELKLLTVTPGQHGGLMGWVKRWWGELFGSSVRCDEYTKTVEQAIQKQLTEEKTKRGTPLAKVFEQELKLRPEDQARFLLYREMLRAAGPEIPAPSLTGAYWALRGARVVGVPVIWAAGGAAIGAGIGALFGGVGAGPGAVAGAVLGAAGGAAKNVLKKGVPNELERILDTISSLIATGLFLTWWGPYIVGTANAILLGLFPFFFIWALFPQEQFRPIALYFATLFITTSTPIWWSLSDLAARLAEGTPPDIWLLPGQKLESLAAYYVVLAISLILVPIIMIFLIFQSWKGITALWRGGV